MKVVEMEIEMESRVEEFSVCIVLLCTEAVLLL